MASVSSFDNSFSFSGNSRSKLRKRTLLFRYLAEINLILGAWYLQWRITHSINFDALWLSVPLLLAEIYSYFGGVMFVIGLWRPIVREVKSLERMKPLIPTSHLPNVDVFITCYNEPPEIVEKTAKAALAIDYLPTKLRVYVLDDGNSPAMRAMAERLCLEDLQSPLLQQEAERIDTELSCLLNRLKQLEDLTPNVQAAEHWLQDLSAEQAQSADSNNHYVFRESATVYSMVKFERSHKNLKRTSHHRTSNPRTKHSSKRIGVS